jgi:hypothetical protein
LCAVAATAATGAAANDRAAIEPAMAMVRDLIGSSLDERSVRFDRALGLTPMSVNALVKRAVSRGSKAAYP